MPLLADWQGPCPAAERGSDNRGMTADSNSNAARIRELNDTIRYTTWSVFRIEPGVLGVNRDPAVAETVECLDGLENKGVTIRGVCDVAGLRDDDDIMYWCYAEVRDQMPPP